MAKYLLQASYSPEGVRGLLREGGTGRREAVTDLVQGLGGSVEAFSYAFGADDVYVIVELPDNVAAAAASLAVGASGAARAHTVALVTPEEIDEATRKVARYRPPGA